MYCMNEFHLFSFFLLFFCMNRKLILTREFWLQSQPLINGGCGCHDITSLSTPTYLLKIGLDYSVAWLYQTNSLLYIQEEITRAVLPS